MKGKISKRLEAVLRDPQGREQLKEHLLSGRNGRVVADGKYYDLRVDVLKDVGPRHNGGKRGG